MTEQLFIRHGSTRSPDAVVQLIKSRRGKDGTQIYYKDSFCFLAIGVLPHEGVTS
jgi:hypothetical protein